MFFFKKTETASAGLRTVSSCGEGRRSVPGKLAVRCSTRASWLTGLWAEFIAEMARHKISPSGMNCDWLIGDILIGDTSPVGRGGGAGGGGGGGTKHNCEIMNEQQAQRVKL